jgi:uncharacterized protein (DUF849 family)
VSNKVIVTCAITGGMTVPAQTRALPITVDQIIESGLEAAKAGAAVLHLHVRDERTGRPVADEDLFSRALKGLAAETDAVLQPTTGGGRGMTLAERGSVLELAPEMATLNAGSFNFGLYPILERDLPFQDWERDYLEGSRDWVFKNTFSDIASLANQMRDHEIRPEIEIYDVGQLFTVRQLIKEGRLEPPLNLQFVLGVLGANMPEPDQLIHMLRTAERCFGVGAFNWSAAGVGYPGEFVMATLALMLGGNVRVGLEDNLRVSRKVQANSNAELVQKAVRLAEDFDREPATPAEAREILGLKGLAAVGF